ncbi:MAG: 1,4-dihydroxy-6-naphthoate synthase [Deferrisomatales bacterium]
MTRLEVGYSPCPNDTFLFYAAVHGRVYTEGYRFDPVLADVETLNRWALEGRLAMTKASYAVVGRVRPRYWCLRSGGALGRGCGPLVVTRRAAPFAEVCRGRLAVPGLHTTASLLLELRAGGPVDLLPMVFHEIMPAVARGEVDAGVIIHEGRFTYASHGLVAVEDLGAWWEADTGLPLPLGGILLRRDLPGVDPVAVQRVLRRSVEYALGRPEEPLEYARRHAQELDEAVLRQHIGLYVNELSADLGAEGVRAVETLLARGAAVGIFPARGGALFPPATPAAGAGSASTARTACRTSPG